MGGERVETGPGFDKMNKKPDQSTVFFDKQIPVIDSCIIWNVMKN